MFGWGIFLLVVAIIALFVGLYFNDMIKKYRAHYPEEKTEDFLHFTAEERTYRHIARGIFIACLIIGMVLLIWGANTESFQRWQKNVQSEYMGGLERRIVVYDDITGQNVRVYEGKIDIEPTDGEKITFVLEGEKHIIYKGDNETIFVDEIQKYN